MADKLSPCPFCGGKPEFRRSGRQGHYIACTGCDASSNMFTALKDDVRELLTETWNRRSALSPQPVWKVCNDARNVSRLRADKAEASCEAMAKALEQIIDMNVQYAVDRYGDASKAESMACVRAARAALAEYRKERKD